MGKKILVVDDEADILRLIEVRLKSKGYEVVTAANGQEGLNKAQQEKPELIITDILMPEMDGFLFYKQLKKDPDLAKIPVLVLTARGKMEDTFRVMGVDDFIVKPFVAEELLEKVKKGIRKILPDFEVEGEASGTVGKEALPVGEAGEPLKQEKAAPAKPAVEPKQEPGSPQPQTAAPQKTVARTGAKKILLGGNTNSILDNMKTQLKSRKCAVEVALKSADLIDSAASFAPDLIIMDVLSENGSAHECILKLRRIATFRKKPVIVYSFLDKDNIGDSTVLQKTMDIDKAKRMCMESGATDSIGSFDSGTFLANINKYLDAAN
ncbi:MAG: response regulator [Candidatus Omnitrophota bacterium]